MHFEPLDQLHDNADPRSAAARPQTRSTRARQLPDSPWTVLFCFFLDANQAPTAAEPTPVADAQAMVAATEKAEAAAAAAAAAKAKAEEYARIAAIKQAEAAAAAAATATL